MLILEQLAGGAQPLHDLEVAGGREVVRFVIEAVVVHAGVGEDLFHAAHRDLHHPAKRGAGGLIAALQALEQLVHLVGQLRFPLEPAVHSHVDFQQLGKTGGGIPHAQGEQRDLAADVVDEEADLQAVALEAEQVYQGVADPGVARAPQVGGGVGIDAGVLHQCLLAQPRPGGAVALALLQHGADDPRREVALAQVEVEVGAAGFHPGDAEGGQIGLLKQMQELSRQRHRLLGDLLREAEARHRVVAERRVRRRG